jgi:hypothetical protein
MTTLSLAFRMEWRLVSDHTTDGIKDWGFHRSASIASHSSYSKYGTILTSDN